MRQAPAAGKVSGEEPKPELEFQTSSTLRTDDGSQPVGEKAHGKNYDGGRGEKKMRKEYEKPFLRKVSRRRRRFRKEDKKEEKESEEDKKQKQKKKKKKKKNKKKKKKRKKMKKMKEKK